VTINTHNPNLQARYEILHGEKTEGSVKEMSKLNANVEDVYRDKDLDAALDSFDNLFCRRCLVCPSINHHVISVIPLVC
jgi:hypothetical protein